MKKLVLLLFISAMILLAGTFSSCSRKSGCPAYESTKAPTNRKGELSMKGGSSSLFPKSMSKGMSKKKKK